MLKKEENKVSREKRFSYFTDLIFQVKNILRKEKKEGEGKLKKNILEINKRKYNSFTDDGIVYLSPKGEAIFVGDTHGDSYSTLSILKQTKFIEKIKANKNLILVFLGDYIDRGKNSLKNLEIILSLKKSFPKNVVLLRGNHEEGGGFYPYEFPYDLEKEFGLKYGEILHQDFVSFFNEFPNFVITGNGIVGVHGGIPSLEIKNLFSLKDNKIAFHQMRWNDPEEEIEERRENFERAVSPEKGNLTRFGKNAFSRFMKAIGAKIMIRSHEYFLAGEKVFFSARLLSIFSTGGKSPETQYPEITPKFAIFDLEKGLEKIEEGCIKTVNL